MPRNLSPRRDETPDRVRVAKRVLGGEVTGGGEGTKQSGSDGGSVDTSRAQMLAAVGHNARVLVEEANVSISVAQAYTGN